MVSIYGQATMVKTFAIQSSQETFEVGPLIPPKKDGGTETEKI